MTSVHQTKTRSASSVNLRILSLNSFHCASSKAGCELTLFFDCQMVGGFHAPSASYLDAQSIPPPQSHHPSPQFDRYRSETEDLSTLYRGQPHHHLPSLARFRPTPLANHLLHRCRCGESCLPHLQTQDSEILDYRGRFEVRAPALNSASRRNQATSTNLSSALPSAGFPSTI